MPSRFYRKVRVLAVGALAISALAASPGLAGGRTAYTCGVTPNPVTNMSTFYVSGSGYPPGAVINVYIKDKISTWIVNGALYPPGGTVGADGTFSIGPISSAIFYPPDLYTADLGTKTISISSFDVPKAKPLCTCKFSVQ